MTTEHTYIFIDFDGVTHPLGGVEDFRCLPLIEEVLRDYDETRIVIASDWRMLYSLPRLTNRFSKDLRERVLDTTPQMFVRRGMQLQGLREREAMQWLARRGLDPTTSAWCAIDDAPGNWPTRSRLVLTDFKHGFCGEDALRLRRLLESLRQGERPAAQPQHAHFMRCA